MSTEIHPTLQKCAEAMSDSDPDVDESDRGEVYPWEHYLPMARAALNALIDTEPGTHISIERLREIAPEPKPTVEDVLNEHTWVGGSYMAATCRCGAETSAGFFAAHVADRLRDAGLLAEEAE